MIEKAPTLGADVVFLDLEDAVAVDEKEEARRTVVEALQDLDWSSCSVAVRINGLDTRWCYRDLVDVVEQAGSKLDLVLVPKAGTRADVEFVATLLSQIEREKGLAPIGLSVLVETALGMTNVEELAQAAPGRLEALVFGAGDFSVFTQARTRSVGGSNPEYAVLADPDESGARVLHWGDQWHAALARVVVAARAYGLRPIDGPFGDIGDPDGYVASARRAAALGCEGKWAIHPSQVQLANDVFTPGEAEVEQAARVLEAMESARAEGKGAITLDGRLIDLALVPMARRIVEKAEQVRSVSGQR
jgi:malyl-CoA/(S)-citramalyl-CoA lyase